MNNFEESNNPRQIE